MAITLICEDVDFFTILDKLHGDTQEWPSGFMLIVIKMSLS